MKDYRVTIKVRNNRLLKAIEAAGGAPGAKWCESVGLLYTGVNDLINMTASPIRSNGQLTNQAQKLCDVLNCTPDDLWSNEQLYPLEKNFSEIEMDHGQVRSMIEKHTDEVCYLDDSNIEHEQMAKLFEKVMSDFDMRMQQVIRLRFWEDKTFEEIGEQLGITKERARQIEGMALRRLRHPEKQLEYADAIDGMTPEGKVDLHNRVIDYKEAQEINEIKSSLNCRSEKIVNRAIAGVKLRHAAERKTYRGRNG